MTGDYDVAVIGGGPNGLTAAAYLALAGARVIVLEQRFERGGTMTSDDYSTPFTYNQAQAALPLGADNPVVAELGLADQGVTFVEPAVAASVLGEVVIGRGGAGLGDVVQAMFASVSRACVPALYRAPEPEPSLLAGWRSGGEGAAADLADLTPGGLAALASDEAGRLALRYACAASGFGRPSEPIGAVGGFMVARWFSPALVAGGSKNLPNALFRLAASAGADCHVSAPVTRVQRSGPGFALSCRDGRQIGARDVICTLDPRTTFTALLDPALVPAVAGGGRPRMGLRRPGLLHGALRHRRPAARRPSLTCGWPVSVRSRISTITSRRSAAGGCRNGPLACSASPRPTTRCRPHQVPTGRCTPCGSTRSRRSPTQTAGGTAPAALSRTVLGLPLRPVPGAARGAADRAVRRRARGSAAAVRHHRRRHRAPGCPRPGAGPDAATAPVVRGHADPGARVLPGRRRGAPRSPGSAERGMLAARAVMADHGLGARV